jgi:hypothetical protein
MVWHYSQRYYTNVGDFEMNYHLNLAVTACVFAFQISGWAFYIMQAYLFIRFRGLDSSIVLILIASKFYRFCFKVKPKEKKSEDVEKGNDVTLLKENSKSKSSFKDSTKSSFKDSTETSLKESTSTLNKSTRNDRSESKSKSNYEKQNTNSSNTE